MMQWLDEADKRPVLKCVLNVCSSIALLVAASWFSYNAFANREVSLPPRIVNEMWLDPTDLTPGGEFTVYTINTYNKLCPFEAQWSLTRKSDNIQVFKVIEPVRQPTGGLGKRSGIPLHRHIPEQLLPGEYLYASEVVDMCDDGHTYTSIRRKIPITVRAPG